MYRNALLYFTISKPLRIENLYLFGTYIDGTQSYTFHDVNLFVAQLCCEKCMQSNMDTDCEFCWGGRNILFENNVLKNYIILNLF